MGNILLARLPLTGLYRLIFVEAFNANTMPEWPTNDDEVGAVASEDSLAIATSENVVIVDVFAGVPGQRKGTLVFNGHLKIYSAELSIRNAAMQQIQILSLKRAGIWNLEVYVRPRVAAQHIMIYLPQFDTRDLPHLDHLDE